MMDATVVDGNLHEFRDSNVVVLHAEANDEVRIGNKQTAKHVPPLSLYSLITSVKLFGICFTRNAVRVTPAASKVRRSFQLKT